MNIYTSKRLGLALSLAFVEVLLFIMFMLFYTKTLWVSWDHSKAIYGVIAVALLFILTIWVFQTNKRNLKNAIKDTHTIKAKLISKNTYSFQRRKLYIWKYEYMVEERTIQKNYWHFSEIKDIKENDTFDLVVNNKKNSTAYFFLNQ